MQWDTFVEVHTQGQQENGPVGHTMGNQVSQMEEETKTTPEKLVKETVQRAIEQTKPKSPPEHGPIYDPLKRTLGQELDLPTWERISSLIQLKGQPMNLVL